MAVIPTLSKLNVGNQALLNTSNNVVETEDDGSDEWEVISSAFDQWFPILLARKTWNFETRIQALDRVGDSNVPGFSDAFAKPSDSLFISSIWRTDLAGFMQPYQGFGMPQEDIMPPPLDYRLVGDVIHTAAPNGASAKYAVSSTDPTHWSVGFVAALRMFIESVCLRALNDDEAAGDRREEKAEGVYRIAATRSDAEEPRRVGFRSGMAERRRYGRARGYYR